MNSLEIAQDTLEAIRAFYKKSLKSSNKKHLGRFWWFQSTIENRAKQRENASEKVNEFRKSIATNGNDLPTLMEAQGFCRDTPFSEMTGKFQAANCGELAVLALAYVRDIKKQPAVQCDIVDGNHTFCVVGPNAVLKEGQKTQFPDNFNIWKEQWAICDPWANIACLPKDYMTKFKEKMRKWENGNKQILLNRQWIVPTKDSWLEGIEKNKKEGVCSTTICN